MKAFILQIQFVAVGAGVLAYCSACGSVFRRPMERVTSLDPLQAASVCDAHAVALVYETPLEIDYYARPYRLRPGLCELPEVSADRLVYTFRMRRKTHFTSDPCFSGGEGRAVTADDIVYSLKRLADPKNASSGLWTMEAVSRIEAPDPATLRLTLKRPLHFFPWLLAMPYAGVVPREAVERYGIRFDSHAVGSGPYSLTDWWRNHKMVFTRNASWCGWPEIVSPGRTDPYDRIEYLVVDDVSTQLLMFLSGEIDFLAEISRDNWDAVVTPDRKLTPELSERGAKLVGGTTMAVMYVGINMKDPLLGSNRKLRQALNCAFDFKAWCSFFNDRILPCNGPVPPGVDGRLETPFPYAYDLAKARRLLAEAGYPDGIDPKTGRHLVIPISVGRASSGGREQIELLQSHYDRIGIRLDPRYMTWSAYLKAVNEGRTTLFMLGWIGDYPDAENFLQLFHSKNVSPGANHGCYVNSAFDAAYDAAMAAKTDAERNSHWRRAQEIVREDCPWIFLHFPMSYSLLWGRVGDYVPSSFSYGGERHYHPLKPGEHDSEIHRP